MCCGIPHLSGGPGPARTQSSETPPSWGDGPIAGQFLSPNDIKMRDRGSPTDICVPPPIVQVGNRGPEKGCDRPEVTHGDGSKSQDPMLGVLTPPSPHPRLIHSRWLCPPSPPLPQGNGWRERRGGEKGGGKESRLIFKRPGSEETLLSLSLTSPAPVSQAGPLRLLPPRPQRLPLPPFGAS